LAQAILAEVEACLISIAIVDYYIFGTMLGSGFGRALGVSARRVAAPRTAARVFQTHVVAQRWSTTSQAAAAAALRPLSALSNSPWQRLAARHLEATSAAKVEVPQILAKAAGANVSSQPQVTASVDGVRANSMIFEIGITFTLAHYVHIFQSFARGLFQSFRPLLILYVFSHILKAVFFIMGAPLWFSFYSIWMFEVGYGLFQCLLSLIFIGTFYNNLLFARVRPTVITMLRQQREKLAQAARMVM